MLFVLLCSLLFLSSWQSSLVFRFSTVLQSSFFDTLQDSFAQLIYQPYSHFLGSLICIKFVIFPRHPWYGWKKWLFEKYIFWTWIWLPVLTTSLLQEFESRWMSIKRKYIWTVCVINEPYHGLLYLLHKYSRPQRYVYSFSPRWSISSRNSCICNWLI